MRKVHILEERCDFPYCVLRRKSAHSSENSAAKKCTFRRNGVILFFVCCGVKVRLPDAKKCTFRRKGVILPNARSCEKVQISEVMLDFACLLAAACLLRFLSFFELDEIGEISMRSLLFTRM